MLTVRNLRIHGLAPVSLQVERGECLAVRGASGTGKSLLLRAIADLDLAEGEVTFDGAERDSVPATEWRRKVRYLAAEPGWWEDTPRGQFAAPEKLGAQLAALNLDEKMLDRSISRLSTGERQRLAFLRALEDSPPVLLLDEPTGPLDAASVKAVEKRIKELLAEGKTILLVTHDKKQAKRLARRGLRIAGGRVVEEAL